MEKRPYYYESLLNPAMLLPPMMFGIAVELEVYHCILLPCIFGRVAGTLGIDDSWKPM